MYGIDGTEICIGKHYHIYVRDGDSFIEAGTN